MPKIVCSICGSNSNSAEGLEGHRCIPGEFLKKDESKSGATRNELKGFRFDLLVFEFLCEMAGVMAEGVESHGEENWKGGFDNPGRDLDNHIFGHYKKWKAGDRSEPHLAKMAVGCMFLWWFDQKTPQIESEGLREPTEGAFKG